MEEASLNSCLFCTAACTIKFKVESNGKLIKIKSGNNMLSSDGKGSPIMHESETPTVDFIFSTMLSIPNPIWNENLHNYGATNETLTVALCDRCEMIVDQCFTWHCQVTKLWETRMKRVKEKISRSGTISTVDGRQSSFWNNVRKESISVKERNTQKSPCAQNPPTNIKNIILNPLKVVTPLAVQNPVMTPPDVKPTVPDETANPIHLVLGVTPPPISPSVVTPPTATKPLSVISLVLPLAMDAEVVILPTPPKPTPAVITLSGDETNSTCTPPRKKIKLTRPKKNGLNNHNEKNTMSLKTDERQGSSIQHQSALPSIPFSTWQWQTIGPAEKLKSQGKSTRERAVLAPSLMQSSLTPAPFMPQPPPPVDQPSSKSTNRRKRRRRSDSEKCQLTSDELSRFSSEFVALFQNEYVYKCMKCCAFFTTLIGYNNHGDLHSANQKKVHECEKCGWLTRRSEREEHLICAHAMSPKHSVMPTLPPPAHQSIQSQDTMGPVANPPFDVRKLVQTNDQSSKPSGTQRFYGKDVYKCKLCPRFFFSEVEFNMGCHSQLHLNRDGVSCKICGWLLNKCEVKAHGQWFHGVKMVIDVSVA